MRKLGIFNLFHLSRTPDPKLLDDVPVELCCPITMAIMREPVKTECGHTFDEQSLRGLIDSATEEYLENEIIPSCPLCRAPICGFASCEFDAYKKQEINNFLHKNQNIKRLLEKMDRDEKRQQDLELRSEAKANKKRTIRVGRNRYTYSIGQAL